MPKALAYLYWHYWRIRRRTGGTGFGVAPIELSQIESYMRTFRVQFAPWETEIITKLDDIYVGKCAETQQARMQEQRRKMNDQRSKD